jgi:Fe-S cluster assembly iron-binding protein IscA
MKRAAAFVVIALIGCSSKPTPEVSQPYVRAMIDLSPEAREVVSKIATDTKLGKDWWLRLDLVWRAEPEIEINLTRTPPGPDDIVTDSKGVRCVMARELRTYLTGVRVVWEENDKRGRFDVSFDDQSTAEHAASQRWLREETAKRAKK